MSGNKDTVYDFDPHSKAKHQILKEYLTRWSLILGRTADSMRSNQRLLYVDGFAGAGEDTDQNPGSPRVAIETAMELSASFAVPIRIKLIELAPDRCAHLRQLIKSRFPHGTGNVHVEEPIEGDCETVLNSFIDQVERSSGKLGPAFFFLDQFGYSAFSMALIQRVLKHPTCEVFSYLNWNLLHPFMADPDKNAGITKAFGGDEWREVIPLSGVSRESKFREIYMAALKERGGAKYTYPFAMRDFNGRVIYWLFFSTNHLRGLSEMKRAMWQVDRTGGFEFSDRHVGQIGMFVYNDQSLAADLSSDLSDRKMTIDEVEEYVLVNTPAVNFKGALKDLENAGRLRTINASPTRKKGQFSEGSMIVHFSDAGAQRSLFAPG